MNHPTLKHPLSSIPSLSKDRLVSIVGHDPDPLGTYAKFTATSQPQRFSLWDIQNAAAKLMPDHRVAKCRREFNPGRNDIDVMHRPGTGKGLYRGLQTCGSAWDCPICSNIITEHRRAELSRAMAEHRNEYRFVLVTYTLSHALRSSCKDVLTLLKSAMSKFAAHRTVKEAKLQIGVVGNILGLEVTHGKKNGWHPHQHQILVLPGQTDDYAIFELENLFKQKWCSIVAQEGGFANVANGLTITYQHDKILEYVAKFGHEPKDGQWGITHELVRSNSKIGRDDSGRTPFQLLADYCGGDKQAGALFREYSIAFKGRKQLHWSDGLKALLGFSEDLTDAQVIALDEARDTDVLIATLSREQWRLICENGWRKDVLEQAKINDPAEFERWLQRRLSKYKIVHISLKGY